MTSSSKNWLHLYVDAVTERDPYKRLALIHALKRLPREGEEPPDPEPQEKVRHQRSPRDRKTKTARRR